MSIIADVITEHLSGVKSISPPNAKCQVFYASKSGKRFFYFIVIANEPYPEFIGMA